MLLPAPSLTFASVFPYLLGLGVRHPDLNRSELTYDGLPSGQQAYPLLLVEGDAPGQELLRNGVEPTGQDTFTIAVQVLTKPERTDLRPGELSEMLRQTNTWADQLTEQLRRERPLCLVGVSKLPIVGNAGTDLASGWRVELSLKLTKEVNRTAPAAFTPETDAR